MMRAIMTKWASKRGNAGFTMVEMLAALAVVTLVGIVVATGIPAAQRAYVAAMDASNAQILLSTTTTRLRDVLSTADPGKTVDQGSDSKGYLIKFTSMETGLDTEVRKSNDGLALKESKTVRGKADSTDSEELLVSRTATAGTGDPLRATADSITYSDGVFTVNNLHVVRGSDTEAFADAKIDTLTVRVLTAQAGS